MTRFLYIPESYDPSIIPPKWKDYACYVMSLINQRLVFEKLQPDAFVPLMSQLLIRVLPSRDYKKILDCLIVRNVIECDNRYQAGTKSKGYRLTNEYRGQRHTRYPITNPDLTAKLDNLKRNMQEGIVLPVHRYLYRWLQQIDFDYPGDTRDFGRYYPQVDEICNRQFRLTTKYEGRVDTNLTNLKAEFRSYLKYQGRELSTIDICNSQPLFLGVLCFNYYINKGCMQTAYQFKVDQSYLTDTLSYKEGEREGEKPSIMYRHALGKPKSMPDDLVAYLDLCEQGGIYEHLMKRSNTSERDTVKRMFFQVLFSENKVQRHIKLTPILDEEFPTIMGAVRELKRKDYKQVSALLTRTESDFVINRVCRRLMSQMPDTFASTIHDSIVTTTEEAPAVKAVMLDEFKRLCGVQPTLKTERLVHPEITLAVAG